METKEKISKAKKGINTNTEEQRKTHSIRMTGPGNPMFNNHKFSGENSWNHRKKYKVYNNGIINKNIFIGGEIPEGFVEGVFLTEEQKSIKTANLAKGGAVMLENKILKRLAKQQTA